MKGEISLALADKHTMQEVLSAYPGAQRALFKRYHIGGCSSCGFQLTETLGELAARNGNLVVEEVIRHIESSHLQDLAMQIAPSELATALRSSQPPRLLDIRTREEWEGARIEGSALFTQELMQEILGRWGREELVVIYDHLGGKSMDAAAYFLGHGFKQVKALRGGLDAWSYEVDKTVPRYRLE